MEKKSILVVDDDEAIVRSFKELLEFEGFDVDTAGTGEEAVAKSKTKSYNLVLIDIRLPDMEGTKLLTAMQDTAPKMVKMIVTGYPAMQNAMDAVNKGADGYITKPVDMKKLVSVIKKHLKKQDEARKFGERQVKEFIESRVRETEAGK